MLLKILIKLWPALAPVSIYLLWLTFKWINIRYLQYKKRNLRAEYKVIEAHRSTFPTSISLSSLIKRNYRGLIIALYLGIIIAIILLFSLGISYPESPSHLTNVNDEWIGEPAASKRTLLAVKAKKYMVTSANKAATKAGLEIMAQGGNAIDAAIASELVLNVVEPHASGIGGGGFLLYHDAKSGKSVYFDGRETAPALTKPDLFLEKNQAGELKPQPFLEAVPGGKSVGTPGLLKMLKSVHDKYGKLPWNKLFEPAIKLAKQGFEVDERLHIVAKYIPYLKQFKDTANLYLDSEGNAKKVGEIIKNPQLAATFETIASQGIKPFYLGKIGEDVVSAVRNAPTNPGYLSTDDLANYQIKTGDLLCATYRAEYEVCTAPPVSGGIVVLEILGTLENFDLTKLASKQHLTPELIHIVTEATRLAYADRNFYLGDVKNLPIAEMLDKNYLKERAGLIDPNHTLETVTPGDFNKPKLAQTSFIKQTTINEQKYNPPSTTHISVIDQAGNAVSLTASIEYFFGSGMMVDGFMLNNQLTDFSPLPTANGKKVANSLEPKKRPRSSMSPIFVFDKNKKLVMIIGSAGGPRIIQYVVKTIIGHLDLGLDIQEAISLPNFVVLNDVVELEKGTEVANSAATLKKIGHKIKITDIVSGLHGIAITGDSDISGGADPRRNGAALGL